MTNNTKIISGFLAFCVFLSLVVYLKLRPTRSIYDEEMEKAYALKKAHPELTSFDGYLEPAIPDREKIENNLLGVDANNNGIRDDVEIWINRTQKGEDFRNGLRQWAKNFQELMALDPKAPGFSYGKYGKFMEENLYGMYCVNSFFTDIQAQYSFFLFFQNDILAQSVAKKNQLEKARSIRPYYIRKPLYTEEEKRKRYCKKI